MARYLYAPTAANRARIYLSGGVWYAQEETLLRSGAFRPAGAAVPLTVVSAPGSDVSLSGTSLTLTSGLAVTSQPHAATVQWALPLASLPGLSLTVGKQHTVTVTADSIPATTINSYIGAVLCAPSGAYDADAESLCAVSLGRGNTGFPSTRFAMLANVWSNLIANAAVVGSQMTWMEGSAQCDLRALATSSVVQKSHQTIDARTATHLYVLGFAQTDALLDDAVYENPTITISYGV